MSEQRKVGSPRILEYGFGHGHGYQPHPRPPYEYQHGAASFYRGLLGVPYGEPPSLTGPTGSFKFVANEMFHYELHAQYYDHHPGRFKWKPALDRDLDRYNAKMDAIREDARFQTALAIARRRTRALAVLAMVLEGLLLVGCLAARHL